MNKLFQELTQNSPVQSGLKALNNPKEFVSRYINNPQVQSILNQYGSPKNAFYAIAKQKGINPEEILNRIK